MPPPGTVEQFTPSIPKESIDTTGRKARSEAYEWYVNTLLEQGIEVEVTDDYTDKVSGMRHVYIRQVIEGLSVQNAVGNININKKGVIVSNYHNFVKKSFRSTLPDPKPSLDAIDALRAFAKTKLGREVPEDIAVLADARLDREHDIVMDTASEFAYQPMYADLRLLQLEDRSLNLIWQVNADFEDAWYDASVDAHSGETHQLVDFVHWYTYEVFPHYFVSPEDGPDAARKIEPELINSEYSPLGWHDMGSNGGKFRNTQGNNVRAQENLNGQVIGPIDNKYRPTANAQDEFHYELDLSLQPDQYLDAAITSLFYHCNIFHDFLYNMGFDEVSGNFQADNFGRGGRENDPVTANCQDGAGTNNANFATPPDGQPGRMRMYTWTYTNPRRDGDFDSGIIYHEFGHGVSNRLTGGPGSSGCLGGSQPGGMGEGWSDFYAIMFRHQPQYNRNMVFGTGGYVTQQLTIRNWPYSTNRTVAPQLYNNVPGLPIHQIGAVWCTILYEVYWNFVDQHGFDPDWINGNGGNNMIGRAVHDGMKMQPCRPTIVDARDAILDAIRDSHGDADWCLAWDGFATRGLGTEAPTNARENNFDMPPECAQIMRDAGYTAGQLSH